LIWGHYQRGQQGGAEYRGFVPGKLNFTYAVPKTEIPFESHYQEDIEKGLRGRQWLFKSSNELIESKFVSDNLADVTKYIIGTCLLSFGVLDVAKGMLGEVLTNSTGRWKGNALRAAQEFISNVRMKIALIDVHHAKYVYDNYIFVAGKINLNGEKMEHILTLTEASLSSYPTASAYLQRAIVYFLLGNSQNAKKALSNLVSREPRNPMPHYSFAFLHAYEGNLDKATRSYSMAFSRTQNLLPESIVHLVDFPEAVIVKEPNRFHLHYALGLLHNEFYDPIQAKRHFEAFIGKAEKLNGSLGQLVTNAKKLIEEIDVLDHATAKSSK